MSKEFRTSVGGQALMEGIMMRGPEKICCAVRKPDGTIDLTYDTVTVHWYNRVPLVRGVCNMAENLYKGYRYLMHAADIAVEGETEPAESKLDKWFEEHATPAVQNVLMTCAAFVGVVLALFLFTFLPTFLTGLVMKVVPLGRWPRVILEGALKMAIFLGYMFLCTRLKDLHRVFEYHGAEHKTIACYEAGLPLTAANEVDLIVTERGVIEVTPEGLVLKEINPAFSLEEVIASTGARLIIDERLKELSLPEAV